MWHGSKLPCTHRIDQIEGLVDLFSDLGARQHDFARDKDEQDHLGLDHTVNETGKELRLVRRVNSVAVGETLESDGKADITAVRMRISLVGVSYKCPDSWKSGDAENTHEPTMF